ncbi:enoyl-CoA hydratase/isomerase family protein [Nocardioides sp. cx-173]|uniref:enoyl-CoA hydratase/isomerase family protein n=1 Tax=Nocardioides sp. cx-173 TaxID=2898796 RepID=UPI001E2C0D61|nr:enoyl-CoA hydratase/isomerase family protein [Nocardioides sp. cx-173]MCD4524204.1 enoyl-CoA hydratase/isomerase family protein [Nocardioides sp. cx-173]UGB41596.1 enoyl-CoA hydratase/isomerase family protein [Nocardioides sp. cx-173]
MAQDHAVEAGPRPPEGDWLGTPYLRFEREGPFARVVVDRPEARNALTPAMYFGIRYAVRRVDADPDLAGLVITGIDDVFIPGGDLGKGSGDNWLHLGGVPGAIDVLPFDVLRQSIKPVVSAVNGICQGGGLMISLCSDLAVVSERATFRVPELLRGISDTYYAQVLTRLVGPVRTRDLMLTGRTLTATEALEWGLVSRVAAHERLLEEATQVLGQVCQTAPLARRDVKRVLDQYVGLHDRIAMFDSLQRPESREGFAAFIEKRSPSWVPDELRREARA